jgi:hypothetical protein
LSRNKAFRSKVFRSKQGALKLNQTNSKERGIMKKFIALTLVFSFIATMGSTVFAATNWTPGTGEVRNSTANPEVIPMYGYIGPVVKNPVDPKPDDPIVNPWKNLDVSVPVKFIWAAFEPEEGAANPLHSDLDAPEYQIINRSADYGVEVLVTDFLTTDIEFDTDLGTLSIGFEQSAGPTITAPVDLFDSVTPVTFAAGVSMGTLAKAATTAEADWTKLNFSIDGAFDADTAWPEDIQLPEYKVEFGFKAITTP